MLLLKRFALFILLSLLLFAAYTVISSGYFRSIEPKFDGEILQKVALKGAEDIMVSRKDSFALISATDRRNRSENPTAGNGLYLIDLTKDGFAPIGLTADFNGDFAPHGISFFKKDSTYQIMAINHTEEGHCIEVFELVGKKLTHKKTLKHPSMIQPNDLVLLDENRFYFTNDHRYTQGFGKLVEEYGGLSISNVVYFDGQNYQEVAEGIAYANGINYDPQRSLLFVASPRKFMVKVYSRAENGTLSFIEDIPCGTGVDNIEFDAEGNLWIGCHPSLLRFSAYSKGNEDTSPSEIIKITYRGTGNYSVEKVYVEDGATMSASTVAAVFGDLIFAGSVLDDEFLVLKMKE